LYLFGLSNEAQVDMSTNISICTRSIYCISPWNPGWWKTTLSKKPINSWN